MVGTLSATDLFMDLEARWRSILGAKASSDLLASGEVVPEDVEQRAPALGVYVVGSWLDDARERVDSLDVSLDDPEVFAVGAGCRLVDRCDLRLQLQRTLCDARWLNRLGRCRGQARSLELARLKAERFGLVGRWRVAAGQWRQGLDLLDEIRPR